jgi:hypothetical protein
MTWRHGLLLWLGLAIGCDDSKGLVIARFLAVDPAQMCVADAASRHVRDRGILDVGLVPGVGRGYVAVPVAQNNLVDHSGNSVAGLDSIQLLGANVELLPSPELEGKLPADKRKFFVPSAAGLIAAGGGSGAVSSASPMLLEVLPAQLVTGWADAVPAGQLVHPLVIARVSAVGRHGDSQLVGLPADFPIEICRYCLSPAPPACPVDGYPAAAIATGGCFPQQDTVVTCCASGDRLLCGAVVPTK